MRPDNDFDRFIKRIYGQKGSIFTCVTGPNGTGKTDYNLLQMERIHKLGLGARFGSNMPTPTTKGYEDSYAINPPFEMDFIEDLETLEQTCRLLNPTPEKHGMKPYFFFLSELGKFIPKDEAWKKENRVFIQKLQTVRKFGLCVLSDAIDRVDGRVLSASFFNGLFRKPYPNNPKYAVYTDFRTGRVDRFTDIPKCKMWFNTYYTADFYLTPHSKTSVLDLDETEQIVKTYMETGSWKKAGITTQQGKRELMKVLHRYYSIRRADIPQDTKEEVSTATASTE